MRNLPREGGREKAIKGCEQDVVWHLHLNNHFIVDYFCAKTCNVEPSQKWWIWGGKKFLAQKASYPTNNALKSAPMCSNAEIFANKHRLSMQIGAKHAKVCIQCVRICSYWASISHTTVGGWVEVERERINSSYLRKKKFSNPNSVEWRRRKSSSSLPLSRFILSPPHLQQRTGSKKEVWRKLAHLLALPE